MKDIEPKPDPYWEKLYEEADYRRDERRDAEADGHAAMEKLQKQEECENNKGWT